MLIINKELNGHKLGALLLSYALLLAMLFTTDPAKLPLVWLLVPFVLMFLSLFGTIFYAFLLFPRGKELSLRKRALLAAAWAVLPVFLLLLKSVNQLTVRDSLIFSIFIAALVLYIGRTDFKKR